MAAARAASRHATPLHPEMIELGLHGIRCATTEVLQVSQRPQRRRQLGAPLPCRAHMLMVIILRKGFRVWSIPRTGRRRATNRLTCLAQVVGAEDLDEALAAAVTCCILAAAGPQRSRVLANLYKDARAARLPSYGFLEKVYLERILRPEEVRP